MTAPHRILASSLEVIRIYPTCSLRVVRVGGVFWRFLSGKNFLNESVIIRAFSKFCRLIVSIDFPFARPRRHHVNVIPYCRSKGASAPCRARFRSCRRGARRPTCQRHGHGQQHGDLPLPEQRSGQRWRSCLLSTACPVPPQG